MKPADFALVLLGVLLNAAAQLLLKAGANSVGPIWNALSRHASLRPTGQPHSAMPARRR